MLYKILYLLLSPLVWVGRELKGNRLKYPFVLTFFFAPEDEYTELLRPQIDKLMPDTMPNKWLCMSVWFSPRCGNNFHLGLVLRCWSHSSLAYRNLLKCLSLIWGRSMVAIRILRPPLTARLN